MKDGVEMEVISGWRIYEDRDSNLGESAMHGDVPPYKLTYAVWEPAVLPPE